jgi:hypothetical protein
VPTVVATAGASTANSFATAAEFESYRDTRLNAGAYDTADSDDQDRALIEATRELGVLTYVGTAASDTQALVWPRQWAEDPDASVGVTYYASTEIPQRVKDATMELALQFLIAGTTDVAALDSKQGVIEKTVGPLTTRWADPYTRPAGLKRYPRVWNLVAPLLIAQGNSVPLVRG